MTLASITYLVGAFGGIACGFLLNSKVHWAISSLAIPAASGLALWSILWVAA